MSVTLTSEERDEIVQLLSELAKQNESIAEVEWVGGEPDERVQYFRKETRRCLAAIAALTREQSAPDSDRDLAALLTRQFEWSKRTFGDDYRTAGLLAHIRKELAEVEAAPHDPVEWIDVALLALDGAWRCSGQPIEPLEIGRLGGHRTGEEIAALMVAKMAKNRARKWAPATGDAPIEHVRDTSEQAGGESRCPACAGIAAVCGHVPVPQLHPPAPCGHKIALQRLIDADADTPPERMGAEFERARAALADPACGACHCYEALVDLEYRIAHIAAFDASAEEVRGKMLSVAHAAMAGCGKWQLETAFDEGERLTIYPGRAGLIYRRKAAKGGAK